MARGLPGGSRSRRSEIVALSHVEVLVEERSMSAALEVLLPRVAADVTFKFHEFDGKLDLLRKLGDRLKGYASIFESWERAGIEAAVVVIVDEDREDSRRLKSRLNSAASKAGLGTLSKPVRGRVHVLNRIVVEELESWFFGDPAAVMSAYPKVKKNSFPRAALRNPDEIKGGTWEALERVLQSHDYHSGGLRKTECARSISEHMVASRNSSPSFKQFLNGVARLVDANTRV